MAFLPLQESLSAHESEGKIIPPTEERGPGRFVATRCSWCHPLAAAYRWFSVLGVLDIYCVKFQELEIYGVIGGHRTHAWNALRFGVIDADMFSLCLVVGSCSVSLVGFSTLSFPKQSYEMLAFLSLLGSLSAE